MRRSYDNDLRADERCWSDALKARGYSLGYIGKWHLDSPRRPFVKCYNNTEEFAWNEWTPPSKRHGFDFWYALVISLVPDKAPERVLFNKVNRISIFFFSQCGLHRAVGQV